MQYFKKHDTGTFPKYFGCKVTIEILMKYFCTISEHYSISAILHAEWEIRYALLAAEHNLSFRAMEHIISINKLIFKNDLLSKEIKVHRTKCTSIVKNVIAENIKYNISNEMKNKHFSVFVDESTDSSSDKNLCILVKYCNDSNIKIQLLDYIKLSTNGATAKNLFNSFHDCLKNFNLDIKNIVGFCSDNANVMLGKNNSFASHLLSVNKNIFILGCICHSTHLMASVAAEQLPTNVEGLMHSLYTYFSKSPKRQAILVELQEYFQSQKHKIINPSKTRWLALLNAVQRVLEQWNVLQQVFLLASVEERNSNADFILNELNNPFTKAYLQFLQHVLPIFNNFNILFQSDKILIPYILSESQRFVKLLCINFLKPDIIKEENFCDINIYHPYNLLPLEQINIGKQALETLKDCKDVDIIVFKTKCIKFYQVSVEQAVKRLPLKDKILSEFQFIIPKMCLNRKVSITNLCDKYCDILNISKVLQEYELISSYFLNQEKTLLENLNIFEFWTKLRNIKNFNDEYYFRNICKLADIVLALPHSNADVERVFSMCSDIKTKKRNQLTSSTISALLRVKIDMKNCNSNCMTFPIDKKLIHDYNKNVYAYKNKENNNTIQEDCIFVESDNE